MPDPGAEAHAVGRPVPRVSIILNVCNGAAYLREALDSVLAQTHAGWELIFWDDRSTDGSANILADYQDERIRYFLAPEETPLGRARDLAIRQARGEWLAFIDQDDVWLPEKLEKQMAVIEGEPGARLGIVYGRTVVFSADGREADYDHCHEFRPLPEGDIFVELFRNSCFIAMSCAMLRRSAFHEIGGIPDEFEVIPDYHLFVAIAQLYRARAVQEVVCRYRLHAANMSRFTARRMHQEVLRLIDAWAHCLDPRLAARRRRIHHTLVGFEDMRRLRTAGRGIVRILTRGSAGFLLSRPFARAFRAVRRRLRRPCYLGAAQAPPNEKRASTLMCAGREHTESRVPSVGGAHGVTPLPRVNVLGAKVTASSFAAAQGFLATLVRQRAGAYISHANAFSVTMTHDDPRYREIINGASYVAADGMSVVWALRRLGFAAERVHGDDFCLACCGRFRQWRHFLVGGRAGQPEAAADEMRRRFPGIAVVGTHATPARPVPAPETETILEEIRIARPSVVWVGMGTPAQDEWMAAAAPRGDVPMVGVGSLFDLLTGRTRPAPAWMKRSGLQWLFRLWQEPRRLGCRYLYYNSRFVVAFSRQLSQHTQGQ